MPKAKYRIIDTVDRGEMQDKSMISLWLVVDGKLKRFQLPARNAAKLRDLISELINPKPLGLLPREGL